MANLDIRNAFVDGIEELYEIFFNDGVSDGIEFRYLDERATVVDSVYRESKNKKYLDPIMLVANVKLKPTVQEEPVKDVDYDANFKVPFKCLRDRNFDLTPSGIKTIRKGQISYGGKDYKITNVLPTTYVEDVFLIYEFVCEEV